MIPMRLTSRTLLVISIIVSLTVGLGGGYYLWELRGPEPTQTLLREVINKDRDKPETVDFSLFWQVWERLHEKYVDGGELDTQALVTGAIEGMVHAVGDPYTVYLEPATNKKFQEDISGAFSGVGMEIGLRRERVTVIAPIKDSPAERAGIRTGDVIVEIDDTSTEGMTVEEAVSLIRGKKGTTVKLGMSRQGVTEKLVFPVVRDVIRIPALELTFLEGNIAYLRLYSFNMNIDDEFTKAAQRILSAGSPRIIVDLRNNPGGLLDSAVTLAGWFLPPDSLVVSEDFGNGISRGLRSTGRGQLAPLKTVFLINGGSASASEILAGAVHDSRKVPLVGEKTFGKGSVQQLEQFPDGSSLKVTIAKWLTPSGISISDTGIAPTVQVTLDPEGVQNGNVELGTTGKDAQLDKALEIVKNL